VELVKIICAMFADWEVYSLFDQELRLTESVITCHLLPQLALSLHLVIELAAHSCVHPTIPLATSNSHRTILVVLRCSLHVDVA
jgi:hypothetical protein